MKTLEIACYIIVSAIMLAIVDDYNNCMTNAMLYIGSFLFALLAILDIIIALRNYFHKE